LIEPVVADNALVHGAMTSSPVATSDGGAIVIGGDYRGLGIARALGRHGVPVWVLRDYHGVASFSRYVSRVLQWPVGDEFAQLSLLLRLSRELGGERWTLFPTGDESTGFLARNHEVLSRDFIVSTGDWESIETAYDKRRTHAVAKEVGVPVPWTSCPIDRAAVETLECSFPVIIKPAVKEGFNALTHAKAWRVDKREELLRRYDEACSFMRPDLIMIQELISGGGSTQFSFAGLFDSGVPVIAVAALRARQYPREFGHHSTYVISVENPRVEELARRVLCAMRYSGLAEVEFKYDDRVDEYKILDINARVWGWHTLGRKESVDFSYELWRQLHGETIEPARLPSGMSWMRAVTDIPSSLQQLRHGDMRFSPYMRSWLSSKESAIMAMDDPVPAVLDMPLLARLLLSRKGL
jgi:D-aspartate ligase